MSRNIKEVIKEYLKDNLGKPKEHFHQLRFCCPKCDIGSKYNLEINCNKNSSKFLVSSCWSCRYGGIKNILSEYAKNDSWKLLDEFKNNNNSKTLQIEDNINQSLSLPKNLISFHLIDDVLEYLTIERQIPESLLLERKVVYVFDKDDKLHDHIIFPFYQDSNLLGYCALNFTTRKYRNYGKLDYVPYKEFIDINYPIIITEGVFDSLSVVNAIPCLNTKPNKAILEFCSNKDIIFGFDSTIEKEVLERNKQDFLYNGVRSILPFDLENYKDLNLLKVKDCNKLRDKLYLAFNTIMNKNEE